MSQRARTRAGWPPAPPETVVAIKDFFSSEGRSKKRLEKLVRTVTSPYTQSAERYHAMEQLLADGSTDAIASLFERFTITSTKSIEDEEEKGWAYRKLSSLGPQVLPGAKQFCLSDVPSLGARHHNIAWALRVVEDVADAEQEWDILDALLERHPPEYSREVSTKIQMLTHIADIDADRVVQILTRYLADPDENVRFFVIEALIDIADEAAKSALVERFLHPDEDSVRLRTKILDGLADLKWDVSAWTDDISKQLGQEHILQAGKVLRR